jgi:hypothetical protein
VSDHSWHPVDLVAAAADPPEPPTICGLLYPGKRTLLSGETESLKTWLALIMAKAELDAGYAVAWADLDAMGRGEILDRLRLLGVRDSVISQRFLYYEPEGRLVGEALSEFVEQIAEAYARLFVVDAFNSMLGLHGLDSNKTADVDAFWREVAQPICNAGPATTAIDHVVKNAEARGRYSIGSERKASGAHLHIGFRIVQPLSRSGDGSTKLTTQKDRGGFLPRPTIGILELVSDGDKLTYSLRRDRSRSGNEFRPTHLMEKVSDYLASCVEPVPLNNIEAKVSGNADAKRKAVDVLVKDGFAVETSGSHGARLIEHVRPYREVEDVVEGDDESSSSEPRLTSSIALVSMPPRDLVSSSLPYGGDEDEDERRPRPATSSGEGPVHAADNGGVPPDDELQDDLERMRLKVRGIEGAS